MLDSTHDLTYTHMDSNAQQGLVTFQVSGQIFTLVCEKVWTLEEMVLRDLLTVVVVGNSLNRVEKCK